MGTNLRSAIAVMTRVAVMIAIASILILVLLPAVLAANAASGI